MGQVVPLCAVVLLLAFLKGAFGGGFGMLGIPLLALAIEPRQAAGLLAPLFVVMDVVVLCFWTPETWSKRDIALLVPFQFVGIALGFATLTMLDEHLVTFVMSAITLLFALLALFGEQRASFAMAGGLVGGTVAGALSGFTSMAAHAGGPPIAIYLQARRLSKARYVGTASIVFALGNLAKLPAWLLLWKPDRDTVWPLLAAVVACPCGVFLGWRAQTRLDRGQLFAACNLLLILTAGYMLVGELAR